jgi:hypothetical protein
VTRLADLLSAIRRWFKPAVLRQVPLPTD